ncbi:MAG: serine hydrolase [Verrucomicrobiota bacterium]
MSSNRRAFLQHLGYGVAGFTLISTFSGCRSTGRSITQRLPRSSPEAQGVSSPGVLAFLAALAKSKHEFHSFMMVRHGQVVAEGWWTPYQPDLTHTLYSMSKSFTSTSVGLAVAEGRLKVSDRVVSFFPEELPATVSDHLAALRVKDLLTMSVGHAKDPTRTLTEEVNWVKAFLALPIANPPGSVFLYNSLATYMQSAIVQKVTGQPILEYLKPRLFEPLGIEGVTWEMCPRGINTGGWGLNIQTEGLAKFGQLHLQQGVWQGRQILPAQWVEEATTFKIQQPVIANPSRPKEQNDWQQGYCYQFWRCQHNAFRGDGAYGQFTIVMPEQDAVIAITSESPNMQGELDLVWEHLLPAMKNQALPPDPASATQLRQTLASLVLQPPHGQPVPPIASDISGKTFQIEPNDLPARSVTFNFQLGACRFTLQNDQGDYSIVCGLENWVQGETDMPGTPPKLIATGHLKGKTKYKVAAAGAWKDANTFVMIWRYNETPHHDQVTCRFEGDKVKVEFLNSIAKMSAKPTDKRPVLQGKLA